MGGQLLCQLCYGWQTLKCLIYSLGRGGEKKQNWSDSLPYSAVASRCMFEPWEKFHVVVIFILK